MCTNDGVYFGNAIADQMRSSGWFVGQFVPPGVGLRHQTDVEVKWGIHPDGETRPQPWASGHATTISILIRGNLRIAFHIGDRTQIFSLEKEGDYIIFDRDTVHSWEVVGDTVVVSVRFPSVEVWNRARPTETAEGG